MALGLTSHDQADDMFTSDTALRRLVYLAVAGWVVILLYGLGETNSGAAITVGLMAGGAALLAGGLLGFLFGVPHTREIQGDPNKENPSEPDQASRLSARYKANTSLEQISDWLTKIIVGVSLVEIRQLLGRFEALSGYLAKGLGGVPQAPAFTSVLLVYFSICGFVFGFLWARLYLPKWFAAADELKALGERISRLQEQQQADASALALVLQQVSRRPDDPPATDQQIARGIKAASVAVRAQIFGIAKEASANRQADGYEAKLGAAISILKGLIASDTTGIDHRNHSELAYAARRKQPPDLDSAIREITKAIEIRTSLGKPGWKYYEFYRADCRIEQDRAQSEKDPSSKAQVDDLILADLKIAYSDTEGWKMWIRTNVEAWMKLRGVTPVQLGLEPAVRPDPRLASGRAATGERA